MTSNDPNFSSNVPGDFFATTHWSVVLAAGRGHSEQSDRALDELCRTYWFPLYAYVRRRCSSKEDAEDLTQAFFASFLARNYLEKLESERGRFRAYLLAAVKHFLANEWEKRKAQKRGGNATSFSLDWETADTKFQVADANVVSPDLAFDREWAVALLDRVIEELRKEYQAGKREVLFDRLKVFLMPGEVTLKEAARDLKMEEGAARVAVHRLRKRYRALLRLEIEKTLRDSSMVDEEMRALFGAFE